MITRKKVKLKRIIKSFKTKKLIFSPVILLHNKMNSRKVRMSFPIQTNSSLKKKIRINKVKIVARKAVTLHP